MRILDSDLSANDIIVLQEPNVRKVTGDCECGRSIFTKKYHPLCIFESPTTTDTVSNLPLPPYRDSNDRMQSTPQESLCPSQLPCFPKFNSEKRILAVSIYVSSLN